MQIQRNKSLLRKIRGQRGMTLMEVMVAFFISGICVAGIVSGYITAINASERFSLSQAANNVAMKRLEQTACAQWITSVSPGVDQLQSSNFPVEVVSLDLSGSGTGVSYATNITTITNISLTPALRKVHVDCVWWFEATQVSMTNSVEMIRSPK